MKLSIQVMAFKNYVDFTMEEKNIFEKSYSYYTKEIKKKHFSSIKERDNAFDKALEYICKAIKNNKYALQIERLILKNNIETCKSKLKIYFKKEYLEDTKEKERRSGNYATIHGNELEQKMVDFLNENKKLVKEIFKINDYEALLIKENIKTDFLLRDLDNKEIKFSQKAIMLKQDGSKGNVGPTHLSGDGHESFMKEMINLKTFNSLVNEDQQLFEYVFKLMCNKQFFNEDFKDYHCLYSNKTNFDYFKNKNLFIKMINAEKNVGLSGKTLKSFFPDIYNQFMFILNEIKIDLVKWHCMEMEEIDYVIIFDENNKKIHGLKYKECFNGIQAEYEGSSINFFINVEKNDKNIIKKEKLTLFGISHKGSNESGKTWQQKLFTKTIPQFRINRNNTIKLKEEIIKKDKNKGFTIDY